MIDGENMENKNGEMAYGNTVSAQKNDLDEADKINWDASVLVIVYII